MSLNLTIEIKDGNDVLRTYTVPDTNVSSDNAKELGQNLARAINKLRPQVRAYKKLILKTCTCFWKDKSPEEQEINSCHSSDCAIWDLPKIEI